MLVKKFYHMFFVVLVLSLSFVPGGMAQIHHPPLEQNNVVPDALIKATTNNIGIPNILGTHSDGATILSTFSGEITVKSFKPTATRSTVLYRFYTSQGPDAGICDSNGAYGRFWMTKEEFTKYAPKIGARTIDNTVSTLMKAFAVLPERGDMGCIARLSIPQNDEVVGWVGPAASQVSAVPVGAIPAGTIYPGGAEQIFLNIHVDKRRHTWIMKSVIDTKVLNSL